MSLISKIAAKATTAIGIGCTIHVFFEYVADFVVCSGESMQPTLSSNNILLCNKIAQRLNKINRNDIIIAVHPTSPKSLICKRVIAMEGDMILTTDTSDEAIGKNETKTIIIKRGSCWIEGDNRKNSTDSRNYGQIPVGLIKSKVIAKIWPLNEFRIFYDNLGIICHYCAFVPKFYCDIGVKLPNMVCEVPIYDRNMSIQPICFSAFSKNNHSFYERGCTKTGPSYDHCEKLKQDNNDPSIVCRFCEDDYCNSFNKDGILKSAANNNQLKFISIVILTLSVIKNIY
ncbi:hypothetical protein PVAND_013785 [Polypedilum vanderplanki]|uniref:Mitochondrial inner membrane protease subunit n=1 Tax=Polypedilum vanderplanki TaxID=319348 RepID=A0A9J6CRJ6_POLVA|nr:hypothetical protein PVAND_013785 [Polypedilum vanderplanki]